jgi:superoxide dismutase, Fe-Mn family
MAHNNHFFFDKLVPAASPATSSVAAASLARDQDGQIESDGIDPNSSTQPSAEPSERFFSQSSSPATTITKNLRLPLENAFSSIDTLKREFVATAMAMFGPGFVWLVKANHITGDPDAFRLLPTYLAGSPYPGAHTRRQSVDLNTIGAASSRDSIDAAEAYLAQQAREYTRAGGGAFSSLTSTAHPGEGLAPGGVDLIPVLCLNTWEHVWLTDYGVSGKRDYIENWWNRIDWQKVTDTAKLTNRRPMIS